MLVKEEKILLEESKELKNDFLEKIEIEEISEDLNPDFYFKIALIGNTGVGKTSLINYSSNNFLSPLPQKILFPNASSLIFDHRSKSYKIFNRIFRLQIWDTTGEIPYHSVIKNFYKSALCVLVVFSLDDEKSFNQVEEWIEEINKNKNVNDCIKVLVGNKKDNVNEIKVNKESIDKVCEEKKIEKYYETSTITGEGVNEMFKDIMSRLYFKFAAPIIDEINNNKENEKNKINKNKNDDVNIESYIDNKEKNSNYDENNDEDFPFGKGNCNCSRNCQSCRSFSCCIQ